MSSSTLECVPLIKNRHQVLSRLSTPTEDRREGGRPLYLESKYFPYPAPPDSTHSVVGVLVEFFGHV